MTKPPPPPEGGTLEPYEVKVLVFVLANLYRVI